MEKARLRMVGGDVFKAFNLIDTINKSVEIYFICKSAGYEPKGLTDKQLKELAKR